MTSDNAGRPGSVVSGCRCTADEERLTSAYRAIGALLSSDDYGLSVERAATLHPLWQS
jgi:hypothetical protein